MKRTIANFPKQSDFHNLHTHSHEAQRWAEEFEKELRENIRQHLEQAQYYAKEFDEKLYLLHNERARVFEEIRGEASSADEGSRGG